MTGDFQTDDEAYLAALKLRSDIAATRVLVAALRLQLLLGKANFDPNQPRVPAGNPDGGRWTSVGGGSSPLAADRPTQLAADISGFRKHGINSAISRGVGPSAILDAVRNPIQILPQSNGTTRYVGRDAVVVLNPAGEVVTVWGQ